MDCLFDLISFIDVSSILADLVHINDDTDLYSSCITILMTDSDIDSSDVFIIISDSDIDSNFDSDSESHYG